MQKVLAGILMASAVAACVEGDLGLDEGEIGPGSGDREQGRWVLGAQADGLLGPALDTYLAVLPDVTINGTPTTLTVTTPAAAGTCLRATAGATTYVCDAAAFNGLELTGNTGASRLKIVSSTSFVITGPGGHDATGYVLQHNANWTNWPAAPMWVSYCTGDRLAFPLAGEVKRDGSFDINSTRITFVCSEFTSAGSKPVALADRVGNGVVAKAMSWGYVPGSNGTTLGGSPITGVELLHAAVTAARANYCADGKSHTLDSTSIQIFDFVNGNLAETATGVIEPSPAASTTPVDPTAFSLEAVWKGKDPSMPWQPLCLSKLRWQALPLGDACVSGVTLRDPRTNADSVYCEDWPSLAALADSGAVIAVNSQWNDLGLWRWKHATTGDFYSTTVGLYDKVDVSTRPAPGYDPVANVPVLEGTLMTSVGKTVFEANYGANAGTLVEVRSCKKNNDWATATPAWLATNGYATGCKTEGFVWSVKPATSVQAQLGWDSPAMRELKLWKKNSEYATSTTSPGNGYAAVLSLGWLVAPKTY